MSWLSLVGNQVILCCNILFISGCIRAHGSYSIYYNGNEDYPAQDNMYGEFDPWEKLHTKEQLYEIVDKIAYVVGYTRRFSVEITSFPRMNGRRTRARVVNGPEGARILIDEASLWELPANQWAFIVGHEFAHLIDERAQKKSGKSKLEIEISADIIGSEFAIEAGFDLDAYMDIMFYGPDGRGRARDDMLIRAIKLDNYFYR